MEKNHPLWVTHLPVCVMLAQSKPINSVWLKGNVFAKVMLCAGIYLATCLPA